jgi:hypothetical protein
MLPRDGNHYYEMEIITNLDGIMCGFKISRYFIMILKKNWQIDYVKIPKALVAGNYYTFSRISRHDILTWFRE